MDSIKDQASQIAQRLNQALFCRGGTRDELLSAADDLYSLLDAIPEEYEYDTDSLWCAGEDSGSTLSDLLPGVAYGLLQWHGGQNTAEYAIGSGLATHFSGVSENEDGVAEVIRAVDGLYEG